MVCHKIHVLLVEHESKDHETIMGMLNYFSYKVTSVTLASMAISILSKGKARFDLVIANMNSPDSLGFQLLKDATQMGLLMVFMSSVDDAPTTMMALEQGAFLCVRKPMTMGLLRFLKQVVSRRPNKTESCIQGIDYSLQENEFQKYVVESNQDNNNLFNLQENPKNANSNGPTLKRKGWTEWTVELHEKFMAAARQLGQGRCYPKDVLELMNVPGLTRMQVASHLQKCRNASWLPPNERKRIKAAKSETTPRKLSKPRRARTSRFGLMPFSDYDHDHNHDPSRFHQTSQEYHQPMNHQRFTIYRPPTHDPSRFLQTFQEYQAMNYQEFTLNIPPPTHDPSHFHQTFQEDQPMNHQKFTINPPPIHEHAESSNGNHQEFTNHPPTQTSDHAESSNSNLIDHAFYPFGLNQETSNVGLDEQFVYGNIISDSPFELVPIMESSTLHNLYDFQQELDMGFNASWPSLLPNEEEQNQVDATGQWFCEALNPELEKEGSNEEGQTREGK